MRANSKVSSRSWIRLTGLGLLAILVLAACTSAVTPTPANPIQGIVWQWTSVTEAGKTTTVPNPENYTIIFNATGTLEGKADCNNFSGAYSQQNGFTILQGPTQLAYCGEASLDHQYLQLLGNVAAGGPDGAGNLALETAGGAQRMLFKNGGPAPK
jgi:heat shock protein HslJ